MVRLNVFTQVERKLFSANGKRFRFLTLKIFLLCLKMFCLLQNLNDHWLKISNEHKKTHICALNGCVCVSLNMCGYVQSYIGYLFSFRIYVLERKISIIPPGVEIDIRPQI